MNKIKFYNMLNDILFFVLATTTLMGVIERDKSFAESATFALVALSIGIMLVFFVAIFRSRRRLKIQELIYRGNLPTLIEELRYSGLYFHKQIGDVYIFCTKRLLSQNVRLLVSREEKYWCISCDEYSFKSFHSFLHINLPIEKKVFHGPKKANKQEVRPNRFNNGRN